MATPLVISNGRVSLAKKTNDNWIHFQEIPADVIVQVKDTSFSLHKFKLLERSNYIKKLADVESGGSDPSTIDLSGIPGGPEAFEKVAKFCYGISFDITVHNVAALRCAAEYLEMTDEYCPDNLSGRTEKFLSQVALKSLSGALVVLKSCEPLLPYAEDMLIVQRCVQVASAKACVEANYQSHSPPNWWIEEFSILGITSFTKIMTEMKSKGAKSTILARAIITYTERSLGKLLCSHFENATHSYFGEWDVRAQQRDLLEAIVSLFPLEESLFPMKFLCCQLRIAIFLRAGDGCKNELEKRISAILEHVTVDELLMLSLTYDGERLFDLESVKRIISKFVEKEKSVAVFDANDFRELNSTSMQRVAKIADAYLGEIAICRELTIAKFNGIASLVPKEARMDDDGLYRAVDIYLKAHPHLDELDREKVCNVMDLDKVSIEARAHASQNKRLPLQIVLHARYYDQLMSRNGLEEYRNISNGVTITQDNVALVKENEALRTELQKMKMYIHDLESLTQKTLMSKTFEKKPTLMASVSNMLTKWKPLRNRLKRTLSINDGVLRSTKPRLRRFNLASK